MFTIDFKTLILAEEAYRYFSSLGCQEFMMYREQTSVIFSLCTTETALTGIYRDKLQQVLCSYILDCYDKKWCIEHLDNHYFYKDAHEKELIMSILEAVWLGEMTCLPNVSSLPDREKLLAECLEGLFDTTSDMEFHSIIRFRLEPYHRLLKVYLDIAIDEYKLQEEYQAFTEKLTMMVRAFRPLYHTVYVSDGETSLQLFGDRLEKLDMNQTLRSFHPLLKQWGIEAEPSPLLALIALAPEKVVVYSTHPSKPLLMTLSRVFGDRLIYRHPSEFKLLSTK